MIYQGGYTFKSTQVSRTVKSQRRNCWGPMSLSLVLSRSAVCLLLLLPLLLPPPPFLLFSSSPFPQFCHINMNLGLRGFRVPQAAACYVCLVYSSVTMVTDAWVFLVLSVFLSLCFLSLLCLSTALLSPHIHNACYQYNSGYQEAPRVEIKTGKYVLLDSMLVFNEATQSLKM